MLCKVYIHGFSFLLPTKQAYHNLDAEGKKAMAKKYAENGPKNLDWASTYLETSSHDTVTEKNALKGMFSRKEILEAEGVDMDGLDEKAKETILKEILGELYNRLGLDVAKEPGLFNDHKIHQLKKYYYESTPKVQEKEIDLKSSQMQIEGSGISISHARKMLSDSTSSGSVVKVENPHHVQLMNKVKAVMQAKSRLEKEETSLKDIFAELEASVKGKPAFIQILKEYDSKMTVLKDFLGTLRSEHALIKDIDASSEEACNKALAKWTTHGEHMLIHQEGVKGMKSGMKGMTINTTK